MKVHHPQDIYTFRHFEQESRDLGNEGGLASLNNQQGSNKYTRQAKKVRDHFIEYFSNAGVVAWQHELLTQTF